nr:hypothetical protein BaRGS_025952 [Batillaria attramentaria]
MKITGRPAHKYHRSESEDSKLFRPRSATFSTADLKTKLVSEQIKSFWAMPDGHYLVVKLQQGDKMVVEKRTKTRPGNNPIWNEPFLFSLEHDDLLSFSLHLIVMRRRHYVADSVLGHVTIGANQIHNGARHWQDVCRRPGREVARWHSVLPVFAY